MSSVFQLWCLLDGKVIHTLMERWACHRDNRARVSFINLHGDGCLESLCVQQPNLVTWGEIQRPERSHLLCARISELWSYMCQGEILNFMTLWYGLNVDIMYLQKRLSSHIYLLRESYLCNVYHHHTEAVWYSVLMVSFNCNSMWPQPWHPITHVMAFM